jgi:putative oxidoreductase
MFKLFDSPISQGWAIAILRLVTGVVFFAHGWKKFFVDGVGGFTAFLGQLGIPAPGLFGPLVAGVELLGGLLLMFGLFTRWATIPLAVTMLVAAATVHLKNGFFLPAGFEYTLVLFAANLSLFLAGPGVFAVDNLVAARTKKTPSSQPVPAQAN